MAVPGRHSGWDQLGLHMQRQVDQKAPWTHLRMLPLTSWKRGCVAMSTRRGCPQLASGEQGVVEVNNV